MILNEIKNIRVVGAGNMGHHDAANLPAPGVVEKYVQGHYGEKTGKGWYDHSKKEKPERPEQAVNGEEGRLERKTEGKK